MKQLQTVRFLIAFSIAMASIGCTAKLTPEQEKLDAALKEELGQIRQDVNAAKRDDANFGGGLIKSLIRVRLEILKTNQALVEQHIQALETGARTTVVVPVGTPDPTKAGELAEQIDAQRAEVSKARAEADRYSGGLVRAMAETTVATSQNTLAMLEQQYFVAKYGLAIPSASAAKELPAEREQAPASAANEETTATPAIHETATPAASSPGGHGAADCLKIQTYDSSILSTNDVFTELAWKADVANSCAEVFNVRVAFTIYDKDEFELDSGRADIVVPANGTGKARGKLLVSPPEKARRMAKQGVHMSLR